MASRATVWHANGTKFHHRQRRYNTAKHRLSAPRKREKRKCQIDGTRSDFVKNFTIRMGLDHLVIGRRLPGWTLATSAGTRSHPVECQMLDIMVAIQPGYDRILSPP